MWRNFRFLHIFHMAKFEITPHVVILATNIRYGWEIKRGGWMNTDQREANGEKQKCQPTSWENKKFTSQLQIPGTVRQDSVEKMWAYSSGFIEIVIDQELGEQKLGKGLGMAGCNGRHGRKTFWAFLDTHKVFWGNLEGVYNRRQNWQQQGGTR